MIGINCCLGLVVWGFAKYLKALWSSMLGQYSDGRPNGPTAVAAAAVAPEARAAPSPPH